MMCSIRCRLSLKANFTPRHAWLQVPWGKHYPASHRGQHETKTDKVVPYTNSLPLVAIREPYMWMQSMCRHHYEAWWPHSARHCPNLIATRAELMQLPLLRQKYGYAKDDDEKEYLVPMSIKYADTDYVHLSLAHHWSEWYRLYIDADYPRIMVRFEDLLFYGEEITEGEYNHRGLVRVRFYDLTQVTLPRFRPFRLSKLFANVGEEFRGTTDRTIALYTFLRVPNLGLPLMESTRPIFSGPSSTTGLLPTGSIT